MSEMTPWKSIMAITALTTMSTMVEASIDLSNYKPENIQPMSGEQLRRAKQQIKQMERKATAKAGDGTTNQQHRKLMGWSDMKFWDKSHQYKWVFEDGFNPYNETGYRYARSDVQYSKYAQAYRMLGGYIDCDHPKEQKSHDSHDGNKQSSGSGCSRWMMWAAYVNRNYRSEKQGGSGSGDRSGDKHRNLGEYEYYGYEDEDEEDYYGDAYDYGYNNNNENENGNSTDDYYNFAKAANDDNGYYNYEKYTDDVYQMRNEEMMNYYANKKGSQSYSGLDCGEQGSRWRLLGVYRQEFYQYYEQISKHLWAVDDANYIVALAGLDYMTDSDCQYVGVNYKGKSLYAAPEPLYGGYFQMGIYTDPYCVTLDTSGYTYDDFAPQTEMDINCNEDKYYQTSFCNSYKKYYGGRRLANEGNDAYYDDYESSTYYDDDYNSGYSNKTSNSTSTYVSQYDNFDFTVSSVSEANRIWNSTQEYTMTNFNLVYETFMSCTACMDYPTYQDGFFNGNTGYEDDDLINQCWKFYSHSSYTCNGECQYFALDQGTVNPPLYSDGYSSSSSSSRYSSGGSSSSSSSSSGSSSSEQGSSASASNYKRGQVTRSFLETSDRDQFLSNTYFLSSMIIFLASFSTYLFMGGNSTTLKNDMLEKECCADETYLPEDELVSPAELMIDDTDDESYYSRSRAAVESPSKSNRKKVLDEEDESLASKSKKIASPPRSVRTPRRSRGRSTTPRSENLVSSDLDSDGKDEALTDGNVITEAGSDSSGSRDENYYRPPKPLY